MPKYFLNNPRELRKSPEYDFLEPQNGQNTGVNLAKKADFWVHFRSTSSNIAVLEKISEKKSFPLIA